MDNTVEYSSNNSGGGWWLTDQNWKDLEDAGWDVEWRAGDAWADEDGRWLGALATEATRTGLTLGEAITEWEDITGQNSSALGCGCCGPPHYFTSSDGEYYSPDFPEYGNRY